MRGSVWDRKVGASNPCRPISIRFRDTACEIVGMLKGRYGKAPQSEARFYGFA
jgi:hypothetical protein